MITDVYVCGWGRCVAFTSEDALNFGYKTAFIEDCTKESKSYPISKVKEKLHGLSAVFVNSCDIKTLLSSSDIPYVWSKFVAKKYKGAVDTRSK